jgi:hypothetical protein
MYEPITVEIDRNYGDGTYRSQHIKFTGRLVKLIKKGPTAMRLSEWVDRGYVIFLVHVNEEKPKAASPAERFVQASQHGMPGGLRGGC